MNRELSLDTVVKAYLMVHYEYARQGAQFSRLISDYKLAPFPVPKSGKTPRKSKRSYS